MTSDIGPGPPLPRRLGRGQGRREQPGGRRQAGGERGEGGDNWFIYQARESSLVPVGSLSAQFLEKL